MAQDGPKMACDVPRWAKVASRWPWNWPILCQDGPNLSQDRPKRRKMPITATANDMFKAFGVQDGPRPSKTASEGPRRLPRALKSSKTSKTQDPKMDPFFTNVWINLRTIVGSILGFKIGPKQDPHMDHKKSLPHLNVSVQDGPKTVG